MFAPSRRWLLGLAAVLGLVALGLVALAWWVPLPERLTEAPSAVVRWRDGRVAHGFLAPDDRWRLPVDVEQVDPAYIRALLAYEDARFYVHPGVDPIAVGRAALQNLRGGRVVSGASTLSMQLVRVLEPRPRVFHSKVIEALRAMQLELRMSKAEVLEAYLQFAPFGGNFEGVETAAEVFFGHGADRLSAAEIALLISIPQDPNARAPGRGSLAERKRARDRVARRLALAGALPVPEGRTQADVLEDVLATPLLEHPRPVPRSIPHAAQWLRAHERRPGSSLPSTLSMEVQTVVEDVLARHAPTAELHGVDHAAIVVVEHETGDVRALAGSFDFWADTSGAQIAGFAVPRSPGSTLKPLLYALAIDDGRVLPEHRVLDVPTHFGDYSPTNYDGSHDGMVRLDEALSRSLNVPFVHLLHEVGVGRFLGRLRRAGVSSLRGGAEHYGLSVITGGIELSPLDIARVYVALARDGDAIPLRFRPSPEEPRPIELVGPEAAWLTRRALRLRDRPDFPSRAQVSALPRDLHWKTGTSFGHRDAWAVGSGRRYTAVVWLGNFDRRPSRWLVGAEAAGPLLFDVLEGLHDGLQAQLPSAPDGLVPVEVCALSGHLPTAACPHRTHALAIEARVPTTACALHQAIEVDADTGERVRPGCRAGRTTIQEQVVVWPGEVRRWLADVAVSDDNLPPLAPECRPISAVAPPRIRSPEPGLVAVMLPGVDPARQHVPLEADSGSAEPLDWFVDGRWVGRAASDGRAWWTPSVGRHRIVVQDSVGQRASTELEVRLGRGGGVP